MNKIRLSSSTLAITAFFLALAVSFLYAQEQTDVCFGIAASSPSVCGGKGICKQGACYCLNNYAGEQCELPMCYGKYHKTDSSCTACSGNGDCVATDECVCKPGFSGKECEISSCYGVFANETTSVCSGKGACVALDKCHCSLGYTGDKCEKFTCFGVAHDDKKVCGGFGKCVAMNTCACNTERTGELCSVIKSSTSGADALIAGWIVSLILTIASATLLL